MNRENDINEELQQLLDALEQHGKNARRQKRLGELIDSLEASGTSLRGRHDRSNPFIRFCYSLIVWFRGVPFATIPFVLSIAPVKVKRL